MERSQEAQASTSAFPVVAEGQETWVSDSRPARAVAFSDGGHEKRSRRTRTFFGAALLFFAGPATERRFSSLSYGLRTAPLGSATLVGGARASSSWRMMSSIRSAARVDGLIEAVLRGGEGDGTSAGTSVSAARDPPTRENSAHQSG